nr:hypothetical protein CFP56_16456 [Quercus suber]
MPRLFLTSIALLLIYVAILFRGYHKSGVDETLDPDCCKPSAGVDSEVANRHYAFRRRNRVNRSLTQSRHTSEVAESSLPFYKRCGMILRRQSMKCSKASFPLFIFIRAIVSRGQVKRGSETSEM